jgi:hypothetical protein
MLQGQIGIYFFIRQNGMEQVNGLLVISGALDYLIKIAIKVGGYDIHTVGEDMEIIVRMRRYMEEWKTNRSMLPIFLIRSAGLKS